MGTILTSRRSRDDRKHFCPARPAGIGSWDDVFGDRVIATAILDRLLHHAITINIRGNSYRLEDKLKAGLVKPADVPA